MSHFLPKDFQKKMEQIKSDIIIDPNPDMIDQEAYTEMFNNLVNRGSSKKDQTLNAVRYLMMQSANERPWAKEEGIKMTEEIQEDVINETREEQMVKPELVTQRDLRRYMNIRSKAKKLQMEVDADLEKFKEQFLKEKLRQVNELEEAQQRLYDKMFFVLSNKPDAFEPGSRTPFIERTIKPGRVSVKWKEEYIRLFGEAFAWMPIKEEIKIVSDRNKGEDTEEVILTVI